MIRRSDQGLRILVNEAEKRGFLRLIELMLLFFIYEMTVLWRRRSFFLQIQCVLYTHISGSGQGLRILVNEAEKRGFLRLIVF